MIRGASRAWQLGFALALAAATVAAYAPALGAGFIWDDSAHVTRPELQSWHGLARIWFERRATQQYYPVLHSAFWIEHRLWGQSAPAYHACNLALHLTAAFLFLRLLLGLSGEAGASGRRAIGAYFAAALFALHPVGVESVAWISEQKNTLSLVFYLSAALLYLRFERTSRRGIYLAASLCFVCAVLAKSVTATLPAALLVLAWWRRGRIDRKGDLAPLAPWLVLGVAGGLWTTWLERVEIGAQGADFALSFLQRCLLAGRIAWFYLGKLAWPFDLSFVYPKWSVSPDRPLQWVGLIAAVAVLGLFWARRKKNPGALTAVLLFGGALFPALGFFNVYPFIFSYVADHFQYLASLPIFAAAGWGGMALADRLRLNLVSVVAIAAAILFGLGALTSRQAALYRTDETLYRATIAANPRAWLAELNLGGALYERGAIAEARGLLETAEKLQPDYPLTHFDLGQLYLSSGELPAAIGEFETALRLRPGDAEAHNNLGIALARTGRGAEAEIQFAAAVKARPNYPRAHCNWGILYLQQQRWPEARREFQAALTLEPGMAEAEDLLRRLPPP